MSDTAYKGKYWPLQINLQGNCHHDESKLQGVNRPGIVLSSKKEINAWGLDQEQTDKAPSLIDNALTWLLRRYHIYLEGKLYVPRGSHLPGQSHGTQTPPTHTTWSLLKASTLLGALQIPESLLSYPPNHMWLPPEPCTPPPSLICGLAGPPFPQLWDQIT